MGTPIVADPRDHASLMKTTMILCTATVNHERRSRQGRFDAIVKVIRPLQRLGRLIRKTSLGHDRLLLLRLK